MSEKVTNIRMSLPKGCLLEITVCTHTVAIAELDEKGIAPRRTILSITPKTGTIHVTAKQPYDIGIHQKDFDALEGFAE